MQIKRFMTDTENITNTNTIVILYTILKWLYCLSTKKIVECCVIKESLRVLPWILFMVKHFSKSG